MQPDNQDQDAHAASGSTQPWAIPSADVVMPAPADEQSAAHQQYPTPPLHPGAAWPAPQGTNAPSRKRRTRRRAVISVIALALVGSTVIAAVSTKSSPPAPDALPTSPAPVVEGRTSIVPTVGPVSLPASANGLVLLATPQGQAEAARVQQGLSRGGSVYTNTLVGSYGKSANGDYTMVLVVQPFAHLTPTAQQQFATQSPSGLMSEVLAVTKMTDATVESSSDPSAAMTCGTLTAATLSALTCIWVDARGFGFGYFFDTYVTTSKAGAARYTDALRAAAEQG